MSTRPSRGAGWLLLQIPAMDAKARREEKFLRAFFTAYGAYSKRVKRFLPGIY
jgi:protein-S-isoprenylcysteine O-methyltransferase Ste14